MRVGGAGTLLLRAARQEHERIRGGVDDGCDGGRRAGRRHQPDEDGGEAARVGKEEVRVVGEREAVDKVRAVGAQVVGVAGDDLVALQRGGERVLERANGDSGDGGGDVARGGQPDGEHGGEDVLDRAREAAHDLAHEGEQGGAHGGARV